MRSDLSHKGRGGTEHAELTIPKFGLYSPAGTA
jgi:hypothetical protein